MNMQAEAAMTDFAPDAVEPLKGIVARIVTEEDNVRAIGARLENIMYRAGLYVSETQAEKIGQTEPPEPAETKGILNGAANRLRVDVAKLNLLLEELEKELT